MVHSGLSHSGTVKWEIVLNLSIESTANGIDSPSGTSSSTRDTCALVKKAYPN